MHRESSLHEADDPLEMVDADDKTHGKALPHKSSRQPTEHVELQLHGSGGKSMRDGELWTHRPKDKQQEHGESPLHESHEALRGCGELQTHAPDDEPQQTPLVFTDMCHTAMDNAGITATSHGSGAERMLWHEYHATTLWDESLTPGPRESFPQMGQSLAKGKEWAMGERPMQSPKRCPDETWLMRAMEIMECQLHAAM